MEHMSLPVCLDAQCLWFIGWTQLGCLVRSCSRCTVSVLAGAWGTETGAPTPPLGGPKQWARFCWCPRCDGRPRAHPGLQFPCTCRPRTFQAFLHGNRILWWPACVPPQLGPTGNSRIGRPVPALAGPSGGQETEGEDSFLRNSLIKTFLRVRLCVHVEGSTDHKRAMPRGECSHCAGTPGASARIQSRARAMVRLRSPRCVLPVMGDQAGFSLGSPRSALHPGGVLLLVLGCAASGEDARQPSCVRARVCACPAVPSLRGAGAGR